jgi:hypothetical protein
MVKPVLDKSQPAPQAPKGDARREKRLADALRANLRRRKAASRPLADAERSQED